MPLRFYVIPYGAYGLDPKWNLPKYISNRLDPPEIETNRYALINQGIEGEAVIAVDATNPNHAALAAKSDVVQIPANLDATLNATQASNTAAELEARNLPGDWVAAGMTWRTVLRNVKRIFLFFQFMHSRGFIEKLKDTGINLSTEFQDFPAGMQTKIQNAATERGYGTIPPTFTLRQILKRLFQDWTVSVIKLGGEEF